MSSLEIWLVNDDPAQLLVQKRLLGRFAATVWEFTSPDELLTQAQKYGSCPNLVSDFHMPGMNGLELARIWCEMHANAKVLLVSASNLTSAEQEEAVFLPRNHVKLLTSFYIGDMIAAAEEWFLGSTASEDHRSTESNGTLRYFDSEVHSKLVMLGGEAFLHKALQRFADRMPSRMENFREFLKVRDFRNLHREAHSFKGSCGIVGATLLLELADKLELAVQNDSENIEALSFIVNEIADTWQHAVAELELVLNGLN